MRKKSQNSIATKVTNFTRPGLVILWLWRRITSGESNTDYPKSSSIHFFQSFFYIAWEERRGLEVLTICSCICIKFLTILLIFLILVNRIITHIYEYSTHFSTGVNVQWSDQGNWYIYPLKYFSFLCTGNIQNSFVFFISSLANSLQVYKHFQILYTDFVS